MSNVCSINSLTTDLTLHCSVEIILTIVCGSIPALKPIYAICIGRRPMTISSSQRPEQGYHASKHTYSKHTYSKHTYSKHSYVKSGDERGGGLALAHFPQSSQVVVGRVPEDDIGAVVSLEYGKEGGGIQVTRTIEVA
jgi:hypothetical protein